MSEFRKLVEQAYENAKAGRWAPLLLEWADTPVLLSRCSRYVKPGSRWTFLHQAAYFGHEAACVALISRGAALDALTHDARTPADVAQQQGHLALAERLRQANHHDSLWAPPEDPDVLPSSKLWCEARQRTSSTRLFVKYTSCLVQIPPGRPYFVDSFDRVLVGWHGSYSPPLDMAGEPLVRCSELE